MQFFPRPCSHYCYCHRCMSLPLLTALSGGGGEICCVALGSQQPKWRWVSEPVKKSGLQLVLGIAASRKGVTPDVTFDTRENLGYQGASQGVSSWSRGRSPITCLLCTEGLSAVLILFGCRVSLDLKLTPGMCLPGVPYFGWGPVKGCLCELPSLVSENQAL